MRILLLGGTGFLGRWVTEECLCRGHDVTLFHRGLSSPGLFPEAEHVLGRRETDLARLAGRRFDLVVDPSGYEVTEVRAAVRALAHPGLRYVFISTISVYADASRRDESSPVQTLEDAETASFAMERYGALKAACERALEEALPGRVQHVRAGLIVGPHDYDARFPWLLRRIAEGGDVIAPGDPEALVQVVDVRDLAAWMVTCAEARIVGTFNAASPPFTMRHLLATSRSVLGSDARFVPVCDEILLSHDVAPYSEMPFWLPSNLGAQPVDVRRAIAAGLANRPLADTVRDTWAWLETGFPAEASVRANRRFRVPAGLSTERERAILDEARGATTW